MFLFYLKFLFKIGMLTFRYVGSQQARADCCSSGHRHHSFKFTTTGSKAGDFSLGFHKSMVQDAHKTGTILPEACACWLLAAGRLCACGWLCHRQRCGYGTGSLACPACFCGAVGSLENHVARRLLVLLVREARTSC